MTLERMTQDIILPLQSEEHKELCGYIRNPLYDRQIGEGRGMCALDKKPCISIFKYHKTCNRCSWGVGYE